MGGNQRRQFLIAAGGLLAAGLARAQVGGVHRVVFVQNIKPAEPWTVLESFRAAMQELGHEHGRNLQIEVLVCERDLSNLPAVVDAAIARKPHVLLAFEPIAQVLRAKTQSIPIVLTGAFDPVKAGLAFSLRRPGMNVTGMTQLNDQLPAKHLEVLREIHPRLTRVGQLLDESASGCKITEANTRQAARSVGAAYMPYRVSDQSSIQSAFDRMQRDAPDALMTCPSAVLYAYRDLLFENALRQRLPLTSYISHSVPRGVLFAYGSSLHHIYRRLAVYVDRILRGAQPGELPIEQPTAFELVVNLDTARDLGLTIPQSVLVRADRVVGPGGGE
jgi:putative ABC transport system substrate-binding protein